MTEQPFTAELTAEQAEEGERISQSYDPIRRMGMAILTRDHAQLSTALRGDQETAEAYLELAESLNEYHKRLLSEADLMQSAEARLWMLLQDEVDRLEAGNEGQPA